MIEQVVTIIAAVIIVGLAVLIGLFVYDSLESITPISGRVAEKIEVHNGYGDVSYALKVEVAEDRYTYIKVSTKVYLSIVKGVYYKFSGPRDGTSYNTAESTE